MVASDCLISFIIPVYNAKNSICRCLESIGALSFKSYEVIVVNDGSSDESQDVIRQFMSEHPDMSITVISTENRGVSAARNRGIEASKGIYFGFVDADDVIKAAAYDRLLSHMHCEQKEIVDVWMYNYEYVRSDKSVTLSWMPADAEEVKKSLVNFRFAKRMQGRYLPGRCWQYLYRKDGIKTRFFEDVAYSEDMCFIVEVMNEKPVIQLWNDCLYEYLEETTSATHIFREEKWNEQKQVYYKLKESVQDQDVTASRFLFWSFKLCIRHMIQHNIKGDAYLTCAKQIWEDRDLQDALGKLNYSDWTLLERVDHYLFVHKRYNCFRQLMALREWVRKKRR